MTVNYKKYTTGNYKKIYDSKFIIKYMTVNLL